MRSAIRRVHLILALAAGAFLVVAGVSGSILAFEPELDHLLHARLWYVTPLGSPKPLTDLASTASLVMPGQHVTGYVLSVSPDLSYQIVFGGRRVFVNPYTGKVLGIRDSRPDLLAQVHQLHIRLLVRDQHDTGKLAMKWAGASLLVVVVSGLYLWWPLKRVTIRTRGGGRRAWFDLHNAVGIVSLAFLLALSGTGAVIAFDEWTTPFFYRSTRSAPLAVYARPPEFHVTPSGPPIGPDRAIDVARAALPGASPISVNVPGATDAYSIAARYPEDLTPGGRSHVWVDQYSGRVLLAESSRTAPVGTRIITLNRAIHTGDVFGIPSKIDMSLASLAVVMQLVTGLVLWRRRS